MKPKYAIGLAINGNEIRAAFLTLERGKACIHALESTQLETNLEDSRNSDNGQESLNDLEKAFDINDPQLNNDTDSDESLAESEQNNNVSLIYSLVDKFKQIKANVAVNTPVLTVKYDVLNSEALPKDKNFKKRIKDKIGRWNDDDNGVHRTNFIDISDNKMLQIDYEYHPPIIDLIEEVNQFRAGNMNLVLMDTNELALTDLVIEIYKFKKDETTAIIYIEQDFSRIIFLRGQNIYHITPIIHKGSISQDVLEVIYSRMIFAQDQHSIPEINKILVAGHSSKLKAKYYFRQKFPNAITGYLNSKRIQSKLRFKDRGLLFSRYAIPIALAWKALQKRAINSKSTNFLPEYILERHKMPKLALHGYMLLLLLALTAFSFTWLLISKNIEIRKVTRRTTLMKTQVENNKSLTDRVKSFDGQIIDLEKKIALVDSFSKGYDETIEFLNTLSQSITRTGGIWVDVITKQDNNLRINGMAKYRDTIPRLANALGGANLNKVTRSSLHDNKIFSFQMGKKLGEVQKSNQSKRYSFLTSSSGTDNSKPKNDPIMADNSNNHSSELYATENLKKLSNKGDLEIQKQLAYGQQKANDQSNTDSNNKLSETEINYVYGLQIGAFDSYKEATNASQKFTNKGYEVVISNLKSSTEEKKQMTLIVGAFDTQNEAQKLSDLFTAISGVENKIVKYKN